MKDSKKEEKFQVVSKKDIDLLILNTKKNNKSWDRICLHKNASSKMHSMVMCMLANVRSGFHYNKNSLDIITYSYLGYPFQVDIMEDINSDKIQTVVINYENPLISIQDSTSRSILNNTSQTITYLENRAGPYIKEEIIWLN